MRLLYLFRPPVTAVTATSTLSFSARSRVPWLRDASSPQLRRQATLNCPSRQWVSPHRPPNHIGPSLPIRPCHHSLNPRDLLHLLASAVLTAFAAPALSTYVLTNRQMSALTTLPRTPSGRYSSLPSALGHFRDAGDQLWVEAQVLA